jgi:uncharacterized protein (TIGR03437 family)
MRIAIALVLAALPAAANVSGLPVAHTGGFGEPTCSQIGCHRLAPSPASNTATVRIEVGAYVPGATQQVRVIIESGFASRWGFQLTARPRNDNALPAGVFEALNLFTAVRCPNGNFGPCNAGEVEYVTQTSVGTNAGGRSGRQVYGFNWTSPASDIGPVDFAVAALASNNDGGTNGDFTATATTTSLYAPTSSPMLRTARGVLHAAALSRNQQTVAPKQLLSLFGTNLNAPGAFIPVTVADFDVEGKLPTELGKLSVEFTTPGDPNLRLGRMTFVGENQANLQAPDFPVAAADTILIQPVINRGKGPSEIRGNIVEMPVRTQSPGLFTFGTGANGFAPGQGPAAAVNGVTGQIIAPPQAGIAGSVLAKPGDIVLLFGSGFGPTSAAPGQPADAETIGGVSVTIGTAQAQVQYAGAAPNFVGLQQFNVVVPNLAPGNYNLFARIGGFVTQEMVFLPVGP